MAIAATLVKAALAPSPRARYAGAIRTGWRFFAAGK